MTHRIASSILLVLLLAGASAFGDQPAKVVWSHKEKPIMEQLRKLRSVPDEEKPAVIKRLAIEIRHLPANSNRGSLANTLANLATEGDPGQEALQEVANTIAHSLNAKNSSDSYAILAELARYEHVHVSVKSPRFEAETSKLEARDARRARADFTLTDIEGKSWTLKALRGKTVLVNFWATWCPPCRKEMPDLEQLAREFKDRGLLILGISDEEPDKVKPFVAEHKYTYPFLLDPGRKVNDVFEIGGIPKSFVYNSDGLLVAQAMDMRTRGQFLKLLALAGLK